MAENEIKTPAEQGGQQNPVSPPGYGGLSEGGVGDPTVPNASHHPSDEAAGDVGAPPSEEAGGAGAPNSGETGERDAEHEEQSDVIPGLLDQHEPLHYESSAEHKSSWPDEGGTGEAGAG